MMPRAKSLTARLTILVIMARTVILRRYMPRKENVMDVPMMNTNLPTQQVPSARKEIEN